MLRLFHAALIALENIHWAMWRYSKLSVQGYFSTLTIAQVVESRLSVADSKYLPSDECIRAASNYCLKVSNPVHCSNRVSLIEILEGFAASEVHCRDDPRDM